MEVIKITMPMYIDMLPKKNRARARAKFLLRLAALMCTELGSISALSRRIGMHQNTLNAMLSAGSLDKGVPVNIIKAIEQAIGPGAIPREILNPEVYGEEL